MTTTTAQEEQSRNTTPVPPVQPCSNDEISPKASPKKSRRFNFHPEGSPGRLRRILSRKSERNAEGTWFCNSLPTDFQPLILFVLMYLKKQTVEMFKLFNS